MYAVQEVLLTPWANAAAIRTLEQCACCDTSARKPKGCFHMGLGAPWIQFLYRQHFVRRKLVWLQSGAQQSKAKCMARWPHSILRPVQERGLGDLLHQLRVQRMMQKHRSSLRGHVCTSDNHEQLGTSP